MTRPRTGVFRSPSGSTILNYEERIIDWWRLTKDERLELERLLAKACAP